MTKQIACTLATAALIGCSTTTSYAPTPAVATCQSEVAQEAPEPTFGETFAEILRGNSDAPADHRKARRKVLDSCMARHGLSRVER